MTCRELLIDRSDVWSETACDCDRAQPGTRLCRGHLIGLQHSVSILARHRAEVEMKLNNALATNWSCGYTLGMKTAISIPNDLFDGAERLARRTRRSRSRLFTDALREYLARHTPDRVTESMDQAIMEVGEGKDEFVSSVARRRLERTEW